MRPLGLFAIGLCGACFSKPPDLTRGDGGVPIDQSMPPGCSGNVFTQPEEMVEFRGKATGEPTITGDHQEIFYTVELSHPTPPSTPNTYEVHTAVFDPLSGRYTNLRKADFSVEDLQPPDPSITADGTLLAFRANSDGVALGFFVTRQPGGAFSTPVLLPGMEVTPLKSLDLSWDGLTLYFNSRNLLEYATRTTREGSFEIKGAIGGDVLYPTLSSDGREMYYRGDQTEFLQRVMRTSTTVSFTDPAVDYAIGSDPDLSPDGSVLVMATLNQSSLQIARRSCD